MNRLRIDRLLEAHTLESVAADDAEVASLWAAALREWSDASVIGLSVPGAFSHVYQAAFRAATAAVRCAGFRTRGAVSGHHYVTFYALAALGGRGLERSADALQDLRGGRHTALYGDPEELDAEDLASARRDVGQLLSEVHAWLIAARPSLQTRLGSP